MIRSGKIVSPFVIILFILPIVTFADPGGNDYTALIRADRSLVVPGKGGEGILLGEDASAAVGSLTEDNFTVSRFKNERDLYHDVFKIKSPHRILFDKIIYFPSLETVLLSLQGKISSIVGLSSRRITSDSIDLGKGIEYILFSYGNQRLFTRKNKNSAVYIYLDNGIAFVDDNSDNSLDMYILFKKGG
jgi:energy-coupling factor transporter transmembrane protein EcfT